MNAKDVRDLPVAIIGAGPIGLSAAAHLAESGVAFEIFESGATPGASVLDWGHVRLFTPWRMNVDESAQRLLRRSQWQMPDPDEHPTGRELVRHYLAPLAELPEIKPVLHVNRPVVAVTRRGLDKGRTEGRTDAPFVVTTSHAGELHRTLARAVIDASGTWNQPNPAGSDGQPALGEHEAGPAVAYGIPDVLGSDRSRYAGQRIAVIGSGHSAQNVVRDLAALADRDPNTSITWLIRRSQLKRSPVEGAGDRLFERVRLEADAAAVVSHGNARLVTDFHLEEIRAASTGLVAVSVEGRDVGPFDRVVAATGFRPDLGVLSELRVDIDPALDCARSLAPLIDPNVHNCGTVPLHGVAELAHPERGLYVVGVKSYGRAPTFLLSTGYEQIRSITAAITGLPLAATTPVMACGPEVSCDGSPSPTAVTCCG